MNGVINVYKEASWTSGDVVNKLKGVLHERHIGHGGTLDPDATGVLPVCVSKATRLFDYITAFHKTYLARIHFGITTDTEDASGNILTQKEVSFTLSELDTVLKAFVGKIRQVPPMYSALHVNGQRLYDLARKGESIELEPREIEIFSIERVSEMENNECTVRVTCGKGTYIRTLCKDIGERLSCGAHMKTLVRERAAGLDIKDAITIDEIQKRVAEGDLSFIRPIEEAINFMPKAIIDKSMFKALDNGNPTDEAHVLSGNDSEGFVRIYCDGVFFGIGYKKDHSFYLKCKLKQEEK